MKKQIDYYIAIPLAILFVYINLNIKEKSFMVSSNCSSYSFNIRQEDFIKENEIKLEEYNIKLKELEELRLKEEQERLELERLELERRLLEEKRLEEERIRNVNYDPNNLLMVTGMTVDEMYAILPDTMKHLAYSIITSEREYGVSAFFTTSIIALESAWATSNRAIYSNNLTGMAVYGDESPGIYYESQDECVYNTVYQLKNNYLSSDGMFHNGYSSYSVNIKYCESSDWHIKIDTIAYELLNKYDKIFRENL